MQGIAQVNEIYLDYQASTPLSEKAREVMNNVEEIAFANPHAEHALGWKAAKIIDNAAYDISQFINALESEIIFTSGATEANNLAIIGTGISAYKNSSRKKIVTSEIEHKCVLGACKFLEKNFDYEIIIAPVKQDGSIDLERLNLLIDNDVLLVSIMAVNNEIGTNQPINEIGKICQENGAIFHVDASQALYKKIDVIEDNIDLLSLSSHKMYGPKGVGALFISQQISIEPTPLFQGGGQQNGYRSGTVPTQLVAGFAAAVNELVKKRDEEAKSLTSLRNYAWQKIKKEFTNARLNGSLENRHPGNLNITLPNIDAKAIIGSLQPEILISTGSACTSGETKASHVLKAIGLDTALAENSIRISIGRQTAQQEIDIAIAKIIAAAKTYQEEFSTKAPSYG